jgi:cell fate regulator YaaT (PSP1 superfamily)
MCSTGGGCGKSGGCASGSCNKLNSFDWLGNMSVDVLPDYDIVEIRFKNGRKEFFRRGNLSELYIGDFVAVEMQTGYHIGEVTLTGELVRLQMKKKGVVLNDDIKSVQRIASKRDLEKRAEAIKREDTTLYRTRTIVTELKLDMKLSDVEFQADQSKAIFYYSAEDRVDFRELIKILAGEFRVRVEMKQISLRHEAGRLGGIGSCGRELCCSTWLTDFKNVQTSAARYQNLSLNPSKLSGQCGRLKCCLNYELDTYLQALKDIPEVNEALKTSKGLARIQKTDIFRRIMWFGYAEESNWVALSIDRVRQIQELNAAGTIPFSLESDSAPEIDQQVTIKEKMELSRFDSTFKKNTKKKKKPNNSRGPEGQGPKPQNRENRENRGSGVQSANPQPKDRPAGQEQRPRPPQPRQNREPRPDQQKGQGGPKGPQNGGEGQKNQNRRPFRPNKGKGPNPDGPKPTNDGNVS